MRVNQLHCLPMLNKYFKMIKTHTTTHTNTFTTSPEIKLSYVKGLKEIVLSEISQYKSLDILREEGESLYLCFDDVAMKLVKNLKSVSRAYITIQSIDYSPLYISNHKSIIKNLIEIVLQNAEDLQQDGPLRHDITRHDISRHDIAKNKFKTFKISCAGNDSSEVKEIANYIVENFKLKESREANEADLKIQIIKPQNVWEINIQITRRPLSVRNYKIENMSGAMDATVAFALNYLCDLESAKTYLNIFSGSGTLLIEAGLNYKNLEKIIGFDNDKKHLSLSVQNIKNAGLMSSVNIKEFDIFENPDLGKFDVITSDLPFGMIISKGEDLNVLYRKFVEYCKSILNEHGRIACYTSEYELLENIVNEDSSDLKITKELLIEIPTNADAILKTKILILRRL